MQGQGRRQPFAIHIGIHAAIGVAGDVAQACALARLFVEAMDGQDRKHLVNRPGVRHRLKHAEVADVLSRELPTQVRDVIGHLAGLESAGQGFNILCNLPVQRIRCGFDIEL